MKYQIAGICETGAVRETNQDSIFWKQNEKAAMCVVADGMGGHFHGEIASQMITQTMAACWNQLFSRVAPVSGFQQMIQLIQNALEEANRRLWNQYSVKATCGSTLVILFCYEGACAVFSAGDSRIYQKSFLSFQQITRDEVWENQVRLSEADRRNMAHANRGKLVNAFGSGENLHLQVFTKSLKGGELFLLCSDGLYKMCDDKKIRQAMSRAYAGGERLGEVIQTLKRDVYAAGAKDNFSVILLKTGK